ncbi:MerR family transcriptional regulator [Streptomyces sp. NBC_00250]|uniref:MerR family transcriptional regulator n=1 Tax=Streptomyces sp. NBC_00250 TaxID=2903641 RepID=UPI002E2A84F0|nr:MerR family transcriptional regulator [Streptomyces sp. NBC_00250]
MRIGELARRSGVSERSLRYYETQGLLRAERTPGGQRQYGEWAVDRVIRVQALYAAGLNSKKIAQLLPCMRDTDGAPSETATPQLVDELAAERDRINRMITDLVRSRDVLDEVIATAGVGLGTAVAQSHQSDRRSERTVPAPAATGSWTVSLR